MIQISALKNQLDEIRQRGDYGEDTEASTLQRKLERETGIREEKEQQVSIIGLNKGWQGSNGFNMSSLSEKKSEHNH